MFESVADTAAAPTGRLHARKSPRRTFEYNRGYKAATRPLQRLIHAVYPDTSLHHPRPPTGVQPGHTAPTTGQLEPTAPR